MSIRQLVVTWPSLSARVRVDLDTIRAPRLSEIIWSALPVDSIQGHAVLSGCMLFATSRISTLLRENVVLSSEMSEGTCYFANGSQNLGLIYGPITEPEGQSVWGMVVAGDLPELRRVGEAVWRNLLSPSVEASRNRLSKHAIPVRFDRGTPEE